MPIRIYALAKELQVDSKELIEVCKKAGVTGKGSALASLSDDEVQKLKAFLTGDTERTSRSSKAIDAPVRPKAPAKPKRPIQIGSQRTSKPAHIPSQTRQSADSKEAAATAPSSATTPTLPDTNREAPSKSASEPKAPSAPPVSDAPGKPNLEVPTRPLAPIGIGGKPRMIGAKQDGGKPTAKPKPSKGAPVVKLAPIPQADQPPPKPAENANEPAPQKPIMTLPKDAIRGAKEGSSAPLRNFTKQQDRKRAQDRMVTPNEVDQSGTGKSDRRGKKDKSRFRDETEEPAPKKGLAGMASARASRARGTTGARPAGRRNVRGMRSLRGRPGRRKGVNTAAPRKGAIVCEMPCTIRSFSEAVGIPAIGILRTLMGMEIAVSNINAELDLDLAEMIAEEAGIDVDFREPETLEDKLIETMEAKEDDPADLVPRPPVVTFLGHVDHGKTSLLDYLIGINVVSGEAGGITQHIRAYTIQKDDRTISFVDTPGHEAFTEMRARGANVTDIAVLVVAADDGVMPQTEEAISHAKAAEVPIVVALNKMDLPGVDENKALQDLSTRDLLPSEWGGDIEVVKTSATTGMGMDDLLETLLLTADLHEYKANPKRPALGTCLEAQQEGRRGVVAKLIVQNGTLRVGDVIVCGSAHGKVKAMYDTLKPRKKITEAGPSQPVNVMGLDIAPEAGDRFHVLDDISQAREIAESREHESRSQSLSGRGSTRVSFEEFMQRIEDGVLGEDEEIVTLNIILRADVRGTIEAIQNELSKIDHPEVEIKLLQASVGGVTVADVTLADASNAVIVGFNVIPDEAARSLADERGVEIRRYDIIYKVTEDIKAILEGRLKPDEEVVELGRALVQRTFSISRVGTIAGCRVLAGKIERNCRIRVNRDGRGIGEYKLDSLKREKDDAKDVREGLECGIKLTGFNDLKEGDILEAFKIEEIARSL